MTAGSGTHLVALAERDKLLSAAQRRAAELEGEVRHAVLMLCSPRPTPTPPFPPSPTASLTPTSALPDRT